MGKFVYEGKTSASFEDRLLAHLQLVIGTKMRRGEAFMFSWKHDPPRDGRTMVWVHPAASVVFSFSGSRAPQINLRWLDALMYTANQPSGLHVVPEPAEIGGTVTDTEMLL